MKKDEKLLEKKNALEFVEMFDEKQKKSKKSTPDLGECSLVYTKSEIIIEIEEKLFEGKDLALGLDEFVSKSLSIHSVLQCLCILENFFYPIIEEMNKKVAPNLNSLSLRFLTNYQKVRLIIFSMFFNFNFYFLFYFYFIFFIIFIFTLF